MLQLFFGGAANGDVADGEAHQFPVGKVQLVELDVDGKASAIAADAEEFSRTGVGHIIGPLATAGGRRNEGGDILAAEFIEGIPKLFNGRRVHALH